MSTSSMDSRETSYHHGDLKRTLIDAALERLDNDGLAALGLRELARQVGVSPAAPYRHFKSREALLAAVAAEGFRRFTADQQVAIAGLEPEAHLDALGNAYVNFARKRRALFLLMFSPQIAKSDYPELRAQGAAAFALLTQAASAAAPQRPKETALRAWSLVHGLAHLIIDEQIPKMGDEQTRKLIANLLNGVLL